MFQHRNIHKYTWNLPDGKTHNQIDHILKDRRWHSSILNVIYCRRANCETNNYLVVAKFRERLAVSIQAAQKFDVRRFNLRKLNEMDVRQQYQIEIKKDYKQGSNSGELNRSRGHKLGLGEH
jgi:hypothetical protein